MIQITNWRDPIGARSATNLHGIWAIHSPVMVTRIVVPFRGYAGRYVWHCHILEHEDNEMMRPYEVVAAK